MAEGANRSADLWTRNPALLFRRVGDKFVVLRPSGELAFRNEVASLSGAAAVVFDALTSPASSDDLANRIGIGRLLEPSERLTLDSALEMLEAKTFVFHA